MRDGRSVRYKENRSLYCERKYRGYAGSSTRYAGAPSRREPLLLYVALKIKEML